MDQRLKLGLVADGPTLRALVLFPVHAHTVIKNTILFLCSLNQRISCTRRVFDFLTHALKLSIFSYKMLFLNNLHGPRDFIE